MVGLFSTPKAEQSLQFSTIPSKIELQRRALTEMGVQKGPAVVLDSTIVKLLLNNRLVFFKTLFELGDPKPAFDSHCTADSYKGVFG
jgi:hypothetical protein